MTAYALFPGASAAKLPVDTPVPVLVGFRNGGAFALNVTAITGSVNLVESFGQAMQELSVTVVPGGVVVAPGSEQTLTYALRVLPKLGGANYTGAQRKDGRHMRVPANAHACALLPSPLPVALTVLYGAGRQQFGSTFFNATVELEEVPGTVASVLAALAAAVLLPAAYALLFTAPGKRLLAARKAAAAKPGGLAGAAKPAAEEATPASTANEWLEGSALHVGKKALKKKAAKEAGQ